MNKDWIKRLVLSLLLLGAGLTKTATAEVDFDHFHSEEITVETLEAMLGVTSNTQNIDGLALGTMPGLYAIHRNLTADETLLALGSTDHDTTGTVLKTVAEIVADLGSPFTNLILEAGFAVDTTRQRAYIADSFSGEIALIAIDLAAPPYTASLVLRDAQMAGLSDFALLPDGRLLLVLGENGVGLLDPNATLPAYQPILAMSDFTALLGDVAEAPPESVAVNPTNGEAYIFAHDELEIFQLTGLGTTETLQLTRVEIPGWTGMVDLHDLAVDEAGVIYGWDEGASRVVVWDGTEAHAYTLDALFHGEGHDHEDEDEGDHDHDEDHDHDHDHDHEHGGEGITNWRGIAARVLDEHSAELLIASGSNAHGIVRVVFGEDEHVTSAQNWMHYE